MISLYAILISMFSNNILALNQIGLGNEILDPEDAFKMTITKIEDSLLINWKIEKTYYLYQNSIKVIHKDQSIAFDLIGDPIVHKDEFLGEALIFRNNLALKISDQKERNLMNYEVAFQGCAEKRFCYTPIKVKLSSL
jgi:thiol:disulfide interchange protein DsbD